MANEQTQPPIGLVPRTVYEDLRDYERLMDIYKAVGRYGDMNKDVPEEWMEELRELREKLQEKGNLQMEWPGKYYRK